MKFLLVVLIQPNETFLSNKFCYFLHCATVTLGGSVAEWLVCWTQAQKARVQITAVTLLGNSLRQTVHIHCLCSTSSKIGSSPLKGCGGNCRPDGKQWQPSAKFVTSRLTAKNWDQRRNPTLGNRVRATFLLSY